MLPLPEDEPRSTSLLALNFIELSRFRINYVHRAEAYGFFRKANYPNFVEFEGLLPGSQNLKNIYYD
jgi:hypothetical protein